jgi:NAD(P)-dependent dehydrogenase (short-subunit alcohol dehydrogenase family)
MSLSGQVVVVAGATGVVASGATRKFLDAGATVVGVSRSRDKLAELAKTLKISPSESFIPVAGDFDSETSAEATRAAVVSTLGGKAIDHVLSAVGFIATGGAPTATPLAVLKKSLDDGLYNTFLVAKSFLPLVKDRAGASYTLVSGGLAHFPPPSPTLWMATLKNAAVNALTFGLASETAESAVRVNTICIHFSVAPVGGAKNQLGFPADKDTLSLGSAFLGVAKGSAKGQVICLNSWDAAARLS